MEKTHAMIIIHAAKQFSRIQQLIDRISQQIRNVREILQFAKEYLQKCTANIKKTRKERIFYIVLED
jgi:hypothetical protein